MKLTYQTDGKLEISVAFDRWDGDRAQWTWSIDCVGEHIAGASDLRSGANGRADAADALRAFSSFLSAWDEASEGGENADLFPASMRDLSVDWSAVAFELEDALGEVS